MRGAYNGGLTRTEARIEFLAATDRVLPRCREELLELTPLVGEVDGLPSETVALLTDKSFALTVPRTPDDAREVDVALTDGRVIRTMVVDRAAWQETWDGLLEGLDWWAKRWNAPPWMREVARATVVYAAAGWSRSWRLPPFEVPPCESVSITVETPGLDLTRFPASVEAVVEALQPWLRDVARKLIDAARAEAEAAGLPKAPDQRERDTDMELRWEWVALRTLKGYSWRKLDEWTRRERPAAAVEVMTPDGPSWAVRQHIKRLQALLG